jgi:hypothetical protein
MLNTIAGAWATSRYSSGSDQMMRLRLRNTVCNNRYWLQWLQRNRSYNNLLTNFFSLTWKYCMWLQLYGGAGAVMRRGSDGTGTDVDAQHKEILKNAPSKTFYYFSYSNFQLY